MSNLFYDTPLNLSSIAADWASPTTGRINMINNYNNVIKVNGLESVKAYSTVPNSTVILFDANEDIFYLKTTDASNYPSIRSFTFEELKAPTDNVTQYVTMNEFNKFKEEILNGKQFISNESNNGKQHTASSETDAGAQSNAKSSTNASKPNKSKSSI